MKKIVLLGEDDAFFRAIIKNALTEAGYEVMVATNGDEVLSQARQSKPDAVLLDREAIQ